MYVCAVDRCLYTSVLQRGQYDDVCMLHQLFVCHMLLCLVLLSFVYICCYVGYACVVYKFGVKHGLQNMFMCVFMGSVV